MNLAELGINRWALAARQRWSALSAPAADGPAREGGVDVVVHQLRRRRASAPPLGRVELSNDLHVLVTPSPTTTGSPVLLQRADQPVEPVGCGRCATNRWSRSLLIRSHHGARTC